MQTFLWCLESVYSDTEILPNKKGAHVSPIKSEMCLDAYLWAAKQLKSQQTAEKLVYSQFSAFQT